MADSAKHYCLCGSVALAGVWRASLKSQIDRKLKTWFIKLMWIRKRPEIAIGLAAGVLASLALLWILKRAVLTVLGAIGLWLLNAL
jgi:hypothetical protein